MTKGDKYFFAALILCIVFGLLIGIALSQPTYFERNPEIWIPNKNIIVNKVGQIFTQVPTYTNQKAVKMEFTTLRQYYDSVFSNNEFTVIIQQNGTVSYEWEHDSIQYISSKDYSDTPAGYDVTIKDITHDNNLLISYYRNFWTTAICIIIGCIVGIITGYIIARRSDDPSWK